MQRNKKFSEFQSFDLATIEQQILQKWKEESIFQQSINNRRDAPRFVFYEGPPSANGLPGIHHIISRTIKDVFCRYKTMRGYRVDRKAGWDTHGLPVELNVEKKLNISKKDIGEKISIEAYNKICREEVFRYKDAWGDITEKMGYWVDLQDAYITCDNQYIETLWWIIGQLYQKEVLYKGVTIQPYSPAAGTGLSAHELNQPGTYKLVKDTSITALFEFKNVQHSTYNWSSLVGDIPLFFMTWTTTPWTLLSNLALAVNVDMVYDVIKTYNPYTKDTIGVILAAERTATYFDHSMEGKGLSVIDGKKVPWNKLTSLKGDQLLGMGYHQLLSCDANKMDTETYNCFQVIASDHVTAEDGTGIVHMAPAFGADDFKVCKTHNTGFLCLVDKQGKFVDGVGEWSGRYVKQFTDEEAYSDVNVDICVRLKKQGLAFAVEKYEHTYPHCWRTDKPIIYYPLDAWFVKTSAYRDRLVELNRTIHWKPKATGDRRFGNWLENAVDWNLSRTRFWGTPLPIWRTADKKEERCISSLSELTEAYLESVKGGIMEYKFNLNEKGHIDIDLHRPHIDKIILISPSGQPMYRELDLIDVWFDSGAMAYAQLHYPFENKKQFHKQFPADLICEGVDQTRGWFYTLHILATILFDSVAYKNVISNGLVLDKQGNKMSKRLGNTVDPAKIIGRYGADATRWYLVTSASPWDNIRFNEQGIADVKRKLFSTLFNTYQFFVMYANLDGFTYQEEEIPIQQRHELDRWILSCLHSMIKAYTSFMDNYEPMQAYRLIQDFVDEQMSNWYVRLSRRRFWKAAYTRDKLAAFQTLYTCIESLCHLMAPLAPFFTEWMFFALNDVTHKSSHGSIHHTSLMAHQGEVVDLPLERRMDFARSVCSMALSIRKKENIKVRQPLRELVIDYKSKHFFDYLSATEEIIKQEVNVKKVKARRDEEAAVVKRMKPRFELLGKRLGKNMAEVNGLITNADEALIVQIEQEGSIMLTLQDGEKIPIALGEVQVITDLVEGWSTTNTGTLTVALNVAVDQELENEGYARDFINRLQHLRKQQGLFLSDRIIVRTHVQTGDETFLKQFNDYICREVLASDIVLHKEALVGSVEVLEFGRHVILVRLVRLAGDGSKKR